MNIQQPYLIGCTRFNHKTWDEYTNWKIKNDYSKCIYCTPIKIKKNVLVNKPIVVIEMNNDANLIMGIGIIINCTHHDKYYKIYEDGNYNRYTYKGNIYYTRKQLLNDDECNANIIRHMEQMLFTGKGHFKRGSGITILPFTALNKECTAFINDLYEQNKIDVI